MAEASIRLLLVGAPGGEFRLAADMAREAGAEVVMADCVETALAQLRADGGELVMIDVTMDVARFIAALRAERIAVPVLGCGVDAPAWRAVEAIRAGAFDYVPLPPQRDLIAAAILTVGRRPAVMIGEAPELLRARELARAVAPAMAPVLVSGARGTGKEVMARHIHEMSGRSGRFVTAECEGVAAEVLESELFGHEQGAFADAVAARWGKLDEARGGTLFLREIGAMPASVQARLAEALQNGGFRRIGGRERRPFVARIVASTRECLETRVAAGGFRADLLARLALVRIPLPPLSERRSDIAALAQHFGERFARMNGRPIRPFADEAIALMRRCEWPGNVHELEDVVHRAVLLARGEAITAEALVGADGRRLAPPAENTTGDMPVDRLVGHTVEEVERELILQTLEHCHGNRTTASAILGISVRTMRNKLKHFIETGIPVLPA